MRDDDDWMMIEDGLFLARPYIQYEISVFIGSIENKSKRDVGPKPGPT